MNTAEFIADRLELVHAIRVAILSSLKNQCPDVYEGGPVGQTYPDWRGTVALTLIDGHFDLDVVAADMIRAYEAHLTRGN